MQMIYTKEAPQAVGPYAQAVEVNGIIFCSGQIPINPQTGNIEAVSAAEQTTQVLLNLRAVLSAAGVGLNQVVKTTVFLTDFGDFMAMNKVYAEMFGGHTPARSTIQVVQLPRGAKVEIEATAVR